MNALKVAFFIGVSAILLAITIYNLFYLFELRKAKHHYGFSVPSHMYAFMHINTFLAAMSIFLFSLFFVFTVVAQE